MTAFDDGANPSNGAPHNPPTRLRSCCAGGILRCDVPLWPPAQIPPVASQGQRWTDNNPPSPPAGGLGRGSGAPPGSPRRLADADGCAIPHDVSPPRPPEGLWHHRAHRSGTSSHPPATDSTPRRFARDAWAAAPGRSTLVARPPDHASSCSTVPPTPTAHPRPPAADETTRGAPSRRHRQSSSAEDRRRFLPTSPRPTGAACGSCDTLAAPQLCRGGPCPWSMLWAGRAACPPACGPDARRIPNRWPLGSCQLCPGGPTTDGPRLPTRTRTWETPRDRTPAPHRLVPRAS